MSHTTRGLDQLDRSETPPIAAGAVMAKAGAENFAVASKFVPARYREHLLAIYGYARFVDDVGDLSPGDRERQLDWVGEELDRVYEQRATHPVFVRLSRTIDAFSIAREPFDSLVAANRQDQRVKRYETFAELLAYCELSANPVGRLVLTIFESLDERSSALSDDVCTGLQLVEHWQDVKEDRQAGRIYLPKEDLRRFGVDENELDRSTASLSMRRLMSFEVGRARELLNSGHELAGSLSGPARIAICGFVGGGLAQIDAIESASYDVLAQPIKASKLAVALRSLGVFRGARRR